MKDTILHTPKNELLRIDELYAFISKDEEGNEGLCGYSPQPGVYIGMVCANPERVAILKPLADDIAKQGNREIRLVKFSIRTELETYNP